MLKERCGVKYIFHISCVKWIFFVFIIGTPTYKMSTLFFVITSLAAFQNVFIPQRIPRIFTFLLFLCFNLYFKPSGIYWSNIYFCYFVKHSVDIKLFRTGLPQKIIQKYFYLVVREMLPQSLIWTFILYMCTVTRLGNI